MSELPSSTNGMCVCVCVCMCVVGRGEIGEFSYMGWKFSKAPPPLYKTQQNLINACDANIPITVADPWRF